MVGNPEVNGHAPESIISHSTKALEIENIEARLTALEETAPKVGKR
jgi:hypothetical protein